MWMCVYAIHLQLGTHTNFINTFLAHKFSLAYSHSAKPKTIANCFSMNGINRDFRLVYTLNVLYGWTTLSVYTAVCIYHIHGHPPLAISYTIFVSIFLHGIHDRISFWCLVSLSLNFASLSHSPFFDVVNWSKMKYYSRQVNCTLWSNRFEILTKPDKPIDWKCRKLKCKYTRRGFGYAKINK